MGSSLSMPIQDQESQCPQDLRREFTTTHWSVVMLAGGEASAETERALEELCRAYWYPLYAYVRRQGHAVSDAQDLTQDFFARLLERKYLRLADRNRGRFRTFLLTSLKHFLIYEWNKTKREKRVSGREILSLDEQMAESRFAAEPAVDCTLNGNSADGEFGTGGGAYQSTLENCTLTRNSANGAAGKGG